MTRIAILLEPFPIRNTFGAHAWIGERLLQMLLAEQGGGLARTDMRVACNGPTMMYLAERLPAARPYLMQADPASQAPFMEAMADWHTVCLPRWTKIQKGDLAEEPVYEALIEALRQTYPFDVLAYWGTNETLRAVANRIGVPMLWAEYGPLREPFTTHFCLDGAGVNGQAGGRNVLQLRTEAEPTSLPAASLEMMVGSISAYEASLALPPPGTAEPFARLMRFAKGRRRIILLIMQLADDANVLAFGEGWTGPAMVDAALKLYEGLNTAFILRPHPGETHSYHNMQAGRAARARVADRPDVLIFDDEGDAAYMACLSVATEVVSINSSVGFEAGLLGKPVRVLGQASYMPLDGGVDLSLPPVQLHDRSIDLLLRDCYIPADRFWTVECWQERANATLQGAQPSLSSALPRLPVAAARVFGQAETTADGLLTIEGIGAMMIVPASNCGYLDSVNTMEMQEGKRVMVRGWGVDPATEGLLAGVIVIVGGRSVWCANLIQRPDVARSFNAASRLAAGFSICLCPTDVPDIWTHLITAYGITTGGHCFQLSRSCRFDLGRNGFPMSDSMAEVDG